MITQHNELEVYQKAFKVAMKVFEVSKDFPREEIYALTDQIRRSSRSVCSNLAEAWRKRRYENHFIAKLSDSEMEAAETQTWFQFAVECGYLPKENAKFLYGEYDNITKMLVTMINQPSPWILRGKS